MARDLQAPKLRCSGYTEVPDDLVDRDMARVGGAEFKVLALLAGRYTGESTRRLKGPEIAERCGLSKQSVLTALSSLLAAHLIRAVPQLDPAEAARQLCQKTPQVAPGATDTCTWCGSRSYSLHDHHYPVSRRDGGTQTVHICANCHSEFHHLTAPHYETLYA